MCQCRCRQPCPAQLGRKLLCASAVQCSSQPICRYHGTGHSHMGNLKCSQACGKKGMQYSMLVMVGDAVCLNEQTDSMSDAYDCALLKQE